MDDREAQFLVLVGNACNDARLGAFDVEVTMKDGGRFVGVPNPFPAGQDGADVSDTGWAEDLEVGGIVVSLQEVAEIRVRRP